MKTPVLLCTAIFLMAFLPSAECRAFESPASTPNGADPQSGLQSMLPLWIRIGEDYLLHLGKPTKGGPPAAPSPRDMALSDRAFSMQVNALQRPPKDQVDSGFRDEAEQMMGRGKRLDDPPISLDLTFHLLREVLQMARAEQQARQAHSNRKIMELIGK
ncbi:corticoliberin-like [Scyliorhinus canicula]|uniref:corticoliberin-like n=1 Tax=Scyliorhinus canicula TaxID=7830 RepID=UPI0018F5BB9B|nr:corticoliberin-like [Scyliorhinus canicula]